eukprot:CAMPEP_0170493914 /NCGR_PEP_ID=MMETSP0208-20121228/14343_1 /TAXON_ID=197538 /ORGANISM="Strombidium inclinatum, Strain S3" /LENGTH=33 /DNA_ID= /DNA_START= /DNA_END= /DNA_ORIENTATION=
MKKEEEKRAAMDEAQKKKLQEDRDRQLRREKAL